MSAFSCLSFTNFLPTKSDVGGGRIFFSRVDFLCWLLVRYPFHPLVTTIARKRSRSFCQKCRWQVTAKTRIHLTYVALHEVTWSMVVWCTQDLRRDGCSFMWHQSCQRRKYTTSVDIKKKTRYKASHLCRTTCEHQSINQTLNINSCVTFVQTWLTPSGISRATSE